MPQTAARREVAGPPAAALEEPDGQLGAGAAQLDRVEAALGERRRRAPEQPDTLVPRGRRVGLVQAQHVVELRPELVVRGRLVELGVDELRPGRMRAGHDRPVGRPLAHDAAGLLERRQLVAPEQRGIEAREDAGVDDAGQADARVAALAELIHATAEPGRNEPERLGVGVLDPRALDVRIEVLDVDEDRAGLVGRLGDRTRELLLADGRADGHDLARLHVDSAHGEVGEGVEAGVHRQAIV